VRHLKLARPNPTVSDDGKLVGRLNDVEVTLFLPPAVKQRFTIVMERLVRDLGMEGAIEYI
jgi:hypothetical protein